MISRPRVVNLRLEELRFRPEILGELGRAVTVRKLAGPGLKIYNPDQGPHEVDYTRCATMERFGFKKLWFDDTFYPKSTTTQIVSSSMAASSATTYYSSTTTTTSTYYSSTTTTTTTTYTRTSTTTTTDASLLHTDYPTSTDYVSNTVRDKKSKIYIDYKTWKNFINIVVINILKDISISRNRGI